MRIWTTFRCVPPTINDPEAASRAAKVARSISGDVMREFDPVMPGEDFSEMLAERPGAYLFIGNGDSADLHNPPMNQRRADPVGLQLVRENGRTAHAD